MGVRIMGCWVIVLALFVIWVLFMFGGVLLGQAQWQNMQIVLIVLLAIFVIYKLLTRKKPSGRGPGPGSA
jgi:hypothetical protein